MKRYPVLPITVLAMLPSIPGRVRPRLPVRIAIMRPSLAKTGMVTTSTMSSSPTLVWNGSEMTDCCVRIVSLMYIRWAALMPRRLGRNGRSASSSLPSAENKKVERSTEANRPVLVSRYRCAASEEAISASVISIALSVSTLCRFRSFWSRLSATRSTRVCCSAISTFRSCSRNERIDASPTARIATRNNIDVTVDVFVASVDCAGLRSHEINGCVGYKLFRPGMHVINKYLLSKRCAAA